MAENTTILAEPVEPTEQETAIALITKAEIDAEVSTAKAFPRSMQKFLTEAKEMACLTAEIAESCIYSLPRGNKTIEGPSIRMAEILVSCYTNLRAADRVIFVDDKVITAQGIVRDVQKNISYTAEVQRSILQHEWVNDPDNPGKRKKSGRMLRMNDDMIVMTGRAACSIAFRNAVFKVIPAAVVQEVYEAVKKVAKGTMETLVDRRDKAMTYFRGLGVKDEHIFEVLNVNGLVEIGLDELQVLTGMRSAIKNGEATVESIFIQPAADAKAEADKITKRTEEKLNKAAKAKAAQEKLANEAKEQNGLTE